MEEAGSAIAEITDLNYDDTVRITAALAERIVADREANGPFASAEELTRVNGIGEKTVEEILPYVTVSGTAPQEEGEEVSDEDTGS